MIEKFNNSLCQMRLQDLVLGATLISASVLWLVLPSGAGAGGALSAVVYHNGAAVAELPLDRPGTRSFLFEAGRITVEAVPGRGVHISEANCPAKVCMHTGWVGASGETVACLPNRLLVEIKGGKQEFDAVLY